MRQYTLQALLGVAQPYLPSESLSKFKFELEKVPNVETEFLKACIRYPEWMKTINTEESKNKRVEVYFHYEEYFAPSWSITQQNELDLILFDYGTKPTIFVRSYRRRTNWHVSKESGYPLSFFNYFIKYSNICLTFLCQMLYS